MDAPSFVVVGGGKVGRLFAVLLHAARADVSILVRSKTGLGLPLAATVRLIWRGKERDETWEAPNIPILWHPSELAAKQRRWIIILAMRSYDVPVAINQVLESVNRDQIDAVVVPTNGLGAEQIVINALGQPEKVVSAAITYPCDAGSDRWTTVVTNPNAGIAIASVARPENCLWAAYLVQVLRRKHGPEIQLHFGHWEAMKWTKLFLNLVGNAIPAILNWPLEYVYADWRLCELELRALSECLVAMRRRGLRPVDLPGYPLTKIRPLLFLANAQHLADRLPFLNYLHLPAHLFKHLIVPTILTARGGKEPSLLQERRAGARQCENLHLDLIRLAGSPPHLFPANQVLSRCLRETFEQNYSPITNNPDKLLAACRSNT